jgi:hypothetical protein
MLNHPKIPRKSADSASLSIWEYIKVHRASVCHSTNRQRQRNLKAANRCFINALITCVEGCQALPQITEVKALTKSIKNIKSAEAQSVINKIPAVMLEGMEFRNVINGMIISSG